MSEPLSMADVMKEMMDFKDLVMRTNVDQNATIQRLTMEVDSLREEVSNLKQENRRIRHRLQGLNETKEQIEVAFEQPRPTLLSRLVLHSVYRSVAENQPEKVVRAILNHSYLFAAKQYPDKEIENPDSSGGTTPPSISEAQEDQRDEHPQSPRWSGWGDEPETDEIENLDSWSGWGDEEANENTLSWSGWGDQEPNESILSWANYRPPSTLSQTESVHRSWNSHQWTGSTQANAWTSNDRARGDGGWSSSNNRTGGGWGNQRENQSSNSTGRTGDQHSWNSGQKWGSRTSWHR